MLDSLFVVFCLVAVLCVAAIVGCGLMYSLAAFVRWLEGGPSE